MHFHDPTPALANLYAGSEEGAAGVTIRWPRRPRLAAPYAAGCYRKIATEDVGLHAGRA